MSLQALVWALRVPKGGEVDDSALRTLAILADYASETYIAFPSNQQLMDDRGISRATLYRHLAALHKAGYIVPGDHGVVAHLPANRRPKVWVVNAWNRGLIGETPGPSRGLIDPPSGVSPDATHREEQEPSSNRKSLQSPARAREARSSDLTEFPGVDCIHGEEAVLWTNPRTGRIAPRCATCRKAHGRIILDKEPAHA